MKSISHMQKGLLHIETPNGIVNIRVGLFDRFNRSVDSISFVPDNYFNENKVKLVTGINTRMIRLKGE